jgi:hypothetical protein
MNDTLLDFPAAAAPSDGANDVLEEMVRNGARRMLRQALEAEVDESVARRRVRTSALRPPEPKPT